MTSQKSSPRSERRAFSPFMHTFTRSFSENSIIPLLNALFLSIFVVIIPAAFTFSGSKNPEIASFLEAGKSIKDVYRYVITIDEPVISYFIILGVFLFSVLTGVFLFRFMASKKTVNVYYSLGIKRRSLFLAKYAAGTIMLAASIIIPMLLCAIVNIHYVGSTAELWRALGYYTIGLFILSMLCMTVTAAVFSSVGTILESVSFSIVILLLPTFIICCLQFMMTKLIWGSPYGQGSFRYETFNAVSEPLMITLSRFNPLFFLADGMANLAIWETETKTTDIIWPSFGALLIWAVVVVACLAIALIVFQRRKSEICGFLGKNKILNFAVELTLGFTAATAILYALYSYIPHILAFVLALIIYAVVYFVIELILERSIKPTLKGLWKLPIHLVFPIIAFAVFSTGLFGFETRIPDISEIEKVYVDADFDFSIYENGSDPSGYGSDTFGLVSKTQNSALEGALVTERDKEFATQLHQEMINAENADSSQIIQKSTAIVYQLKNGRTIRRYYPYTTLKECQDSLKLYESDWSREHLAKMISANPKKWNSDSNIYLTPRENYQRYGYESGCIQLGNGAEFITLDLSAEQHTALKQALIEDIKVQTAQDRFKPEKVIGYLKFEEQESEFGIDYSTREKGFYPITEKMTHTYDFLEKNNLLSQIPPIPDSGKKMYVMEALPANNAFSNYSTYSTRHFSSYPAEVITQTNERDSVPTDNNGIPAKELNNEQYKAIKNHLFTSYYTDNCGYIVVLFTSEYTFSYFLPEQYATPEIKALFGK